MSRKKWILSGFAAIAICMNMKSAIPSEQRPTLELHLLQVNRWFKANNGKEYSPKEKSLDMTEHAKLRLQWVQIYYSILICPSIAVGYLDEKFFYTTSRRRKIKKLPLRPNKTVDDDRIILPKIIS